MKYIDADRLKAEIERKIAQYSDWAEEEWEDDREYNHGAFGAFKTVMRIVDSLQQEQLPGIEEHGIPGKDFIPVEWVDACEKYGKWKIVQQEQPSDNLKLNMTRTKLELNEIEALTHLVHARAVEPGNFQGLYKNILSKLNKMFDEEYAEREKEEGK